MTPVQALLLGVGAIVLLGAIGEAVFRRTGVPDVILLVAAGVVLGPIGGVVSRDHLGALAPYFAAFTLVVIMFQGGVSLQVRDLARSAARSTLIAVLGYASTVAAIAGISAIAVRAGLAPAGWSYMHGVLLGAILGGSSSIIVFPAMAQARVRPVVRDLLGVESTLTDILCVVFTAVMIDVLLGRAPGSGAAAARIFASFGIAVGIGGASGVLGVLALRFVRTQEHVYPLTLSGLLGLYVLIDHAGGSAALGIVVAAIVLGNAGPLEQRLGMSAPRELDASTRTVHQQMTFLIKTFFFVFLGAMLGPPWGWAALGAGVGIVLVLARLPAVALATAGSELDRHERALAAVSVPRGLAAGVLAVLPGAAGVAATEHLPVIVYSAVAMSIVLFAIGFRVVNVRSVPAAPTGSESAVTTTTMPRGDGDEPEPPGEAPTVADVAATG